MVCIYAKNGAFLWGRAIFRKSDAVIEAGCGHYHVDDLDLFSLYKQCGMVDGLSYSSWLPERHQRQGSRFSAGLDMLERVHTDFLRRITNCRKSTPKYMLYAELGRIQSK